ncbi:multidrug resistance protein, MATE family [Tenacibaculum mesophilum]|uniref:Multidrug-efflux transporter n=1 Tax=Tenacibaculum mesophilum TaxID=104268 RepID=A0ABM7CC11_9FLAO|nr:MATE family efflux transporter [Tenacibaculum mesophilum]AZJ31187.1 MATE family efflux transporter [Tenacibaculum mesophilum]KAF9660238.1 MATE family efflux transporter [Tenacibaculum mesophilum]QFS29234.1 MATE family efflux transporter [Tenacibaculum mesophilum]SHF50322.1 multidrug resistance protein, MATE family [Tenacibaculum mesophilum]BFF40494.1 MATE family efflux transporter [Tenacibaculum mesophilum]
MNLQQYTSEFKYNLKLATPVMLGMLGHTFVSFIDNIMVGQLGTAELAAVSLGNSFMFIAMSLGIGFSTAITPLIAEADSSNNFTQAKSTFKHGLFLCTMMGLVLFLAVFFSKPLMYLMKQPIEVVELAIPYLDLVAFSLIPMIIFQAFKQFSDGMSMTRYPMYATLIANVLNVLLNYLLIYGKFGFPELGIVGAAYGTLLSRFVMVVYLWWLLSKKERSKRLVTNIKFFVLDTLMIRKILNLGTPSAMQMFFEVAIFTAAIWLSGLLGKNPQAANQIALNLSSMTFMVATGLSVASMIRVGNQKGLKNYKELRRIAFSIFFLGTILAVVFATFFFVFHKSLPNLYVDLSDAENYADNMEVMSIAANLLIAAAIFQISDSIQVVMLGALRGLQDVKIPTLITFISYWIVGFPISFFFGAKDMYGSFGIWLGLLAGLTTASILLFIRFNKLTIKLIKTKHYELT